MFPVATMKYHDTIEAHYEGNVMVSVILVKYLKPKAPDKAPERVTTDLSALMGVLEISATAGMSNLPTVTLVVDALLTHIVDE